MNPKTIIDPVALREASDRIKATGQIVTLRALSTALTIGAKTLSARLREDPVLLEAAQLGREPLDLEKGWSVAKAGGTHKAIAAALGINETTLRRHAKSDPELRAMLDAAATAVRRGRNRFDPDVVRRKRERGDSHEAIAASEGFAVKTLERDARRDPELADALAARPIRADRPDYSLRAGLHPADDVRSIADAVAEAAGHGAADD